MGIGTYSVPNRPLIFSLNSLYQHGIVVDSSFGKGGDQLCSVELEDTELHMIIENEDIVIRWDYMDKEIANGIIEERFGPVTLNLPTTLRKLKNLLPFKEI